MIPVQWACCCREGEPVLACGPNGSAEVPRDRAYLQRLHERFPDSELREGDGGRLELWTWVDTQGRRTRAPQSARRTLTIEASNWSAAVVLHRRPLLDGEVEVVGSVRRGVHAPAVLDGYHMGPVEDLLYAARIAGWLVHEVSS